MIFALRQNSLHSMSEAIQDRLYSFNEGRQCAHCGNHGMCEVVKFLETKLFFHIQITSPFGRCVPLQDLHCTLSSGIKNKYQLECIIKIVGINTYSKHY